MNQHFRKGWQPLPAYGEGKPFLNTLLVAPYEICELKYAFKVYPDCHIVFMKNLYLCPFRHQRRELSIKITDTLLEIYYNHERRYTQGSPDTGAMPEAQAYIGSLQPECIY